jgi:hypothetical protein
MKLMSKSFFYLIFFISICFSPLSKSSGTMSEKQVENVQKTEIENEEQRQRISIAAGLLADYEFAAKKLINNLDNKSINADIISIQAKELLHLSEDIISSARFRLPQCDEYLTKTLALKSSLNDMSHETLEKDYHHDGALPKAPSECYHTKDLFVHPATVIILTRDDPTLSETTKSSINAEISEVLGHTGLVRHLVIY